MKTYRVTYIEFSGKNDYEQTYDISTDINPLSGIIEDKWAFKDLFYNEVAIKKKKAVMIKDIELLTTLCQ